jgi:hypothetical protein
MSDKLIDKRDQFPYSFLISVIAREFVLQPSLFLSGLDIEEHQHRDRITDREPAMGEESPSEGD